MTVSLSGAVNDGLRTQSLFPLYILLARPISSIAVAEVLRCLICPIHIFLVYALSDVI